MKKEDPLSMERLSITSQNCLLNAGLDTRADILALAQKKGPVAFLEMKGIGLAHTREIFSWLLLPIPEKLKKKPRQEADPWENVQDRWTVMEHRERDQIIRTINRLVGTIRSVEAGLAFIYAKLTEDDRP